MNVTLVKFKRFAWAKEVFFFNAFAYEEEMGLRQLCLGLGKAVQNERQRIGHAVGADVGEDLLAFQLRMQTQELGILLTRREEVEDDAVLVHINLGGVNATRGNFGLERICDHDDFRAER